MSAQDYVLVLYRYRLGFQYEADRIHNVISRDIALPAQLTLRDFRSSTAQLLEGC